MRRSSSWAFFRLKYSRKSYVRCSTALRRDSRTKDYQDRVEAVIKSPIHKVSSWNKCLAKNGRESTNPKAVKFRVSPGQLYKIIIQKLNIRYHKKGSYNRTEKQMVARKKKFGRLLKKFCDRAFILADESYFILSHYTWWQCLVAWWYNSGCYTHISMIRLIIKFALTWNSNTRSLFGLRWMQKTWVVRSFESPGSLSMGNIWTSAFPGVLSLTPYNNYSDSDYIFWPTIITEKSLSAASTSKTSLS